MKDTGNFIGLMLVPAAVIGVLGLLRKYMPANKIRVQTESNPDDLSDDFSSTKWIVGISMAVIGILFAFLLNKVLVITNARLAHADGPAVFTLLPSSAIWWFFPALGAACWTWAITLWLWSLFGDREKIRRYMHWNEARLGFDSTKAFRWTALLIAMPIGIATILALPLRATLHENESTVGHYATLARQHLSYAQARHLALVDGFRDRNGKLKPKAAVIVYFVNGTRWNSADNRDFRKEVDAGLLTFLAKKTGLPVERAETEDDLAMPRSASE